MSDELKFPSAEPAIPLGEVFRENVRKASKQHRDVMFPGVEASPSSWQGFPRVCSEPLRIPRGPVRGRSTGGARGPPASAASAARWGRRAATRELPGGSTFGGPSGDQKYSRGENKTARQSYS